MVYARTKYLPISIVTRFMHEQSILQYQ